MDSDIALARKLQEEFDREYCSVNKKSSFLDVGHQSPLKASLIDPSLEYSDPTPDLHRMFVGFDKRFFWSSLGSVEVMWSPRMTSSAGICRYRSRNGATTIHLSLPLLKLRPRKDLVETLLHEMIHAYLFVTKNNKDRDGHGPEFQSHMHRINKIAGTNITIYHTFHAEVNLYKSHWWRCNGPCQHQKPFYGMVKRSMNRAPGPYDFWYADHQRNCGGTFIKVKEPENFKSRKNAVKPSQKVNGENSAISKVKTMQDFFKKVDSKAAGAQSNTKNLYNGTSTRVVTNSGGAAKNIATVSGLSNKKKESENTQEVSPTKQNVVPFSGKGYTLGKTTAPVTDKPWLKRFNNNPPSSSTSKSSGSSKKSLFSVPSSGKDSKKMRIDDGNKNLESKEDKVACTVACPICNKSVKVSEVNDHLDMCLSDIAEEDDSSSARCVVCNETLGRKCNVPSLCSICEQGASSSDFNGTVSLSDDRSITCPMCEKKMHNNDLERHLEICISNENCNDVICISDEQVEDDDIILLS